MELGDKGYQQMSVITQTYVYDFVTYEKTHIQFHEYKYIYGARIS